MCKLVPADNNDPAFLVCHVLTETGTKFDFLAIKKKENK
jgi:hypothetical protein